MGARQPRVRVPSPAQIPFRLATPLPISARASLVSRASRSTISCTTTLHHTTAPRWAYVTMRINSSRGPQAGHVCPYQQWRASCINADESPPASPQLPPEVDTMAHQQWAWVRGHCFVSARVGQEEGRSEDTLLRLNGTCSDRERSLQTLQAPRL